MERDLEFVYAVYQTGSFSKAAKFLFASQPTVSLAVQRVEEDLGYSVFDRQSHPLQPTEQGSLFIRHLERIRESENLLRSELDRQSGSEVNTLRLGCSPLKSTYLVPEVIARYLEQEPDTKICVVNSFRQGMLKDLQNHKTDLAFNTFLDTDNLDFTYIPACEIHYLLAVPAELPVNSRLQDFALSGEDVVNGKHLRKECPHIPVTVFSDVPFIAFSEGVELHEQSQMIYSESNFKPKVKITVTSPTMAHELSAKGVGATIVGDFMVAKDSPLLYYHLRTRWERRAFYFVVRKDYRLQHLQKRFIELFKEYMNERGQEENP